MYDLIIIGLGPAGINACIYAKRSNLNILVFEKNMPGGTLHTIKHVDNYLGYNNVDGTELAMLFYKQFKNLKVPMKNEEVIKVELNGNEKIVLIMKTLMEYQLAQSVMVLYIKIKLLLFMETIL